VPSLQGSIKMKKKFCLFLEKLEIKRVLAPIVAILDSGVDIYHKDLAPYLWTNPYEIAGDGLDNDLNGFVDDIHGWNFIDNNNDVSDRHGHGTHVAGIVKNSNIKIMPIKIIDDNGVGNISAMLKAIDYVVQMSKVHKIIITNNSWKTGYDYSGVVENRIKSLSDRNIMFVVAAGNNANNNDTNPSYPASYKVPNVISVASLNNEGVLTRSSNYGANSVSVGAPGHLIRSTIPNNGYGYMSGTSMAAAFVSKLLSDYAEDWDVGVAKKKLFDSAKAIKDLMFGAVGIDATNSNSISSVEQVSSSVIRVIRANNRFISGYSYEYADKSSKVKVQIWINDRLVSEKLASRFSRIARREIGSSRHGFVVTFKKSWLVPGTNVLKIVVNDSRGGTTTETRHIVRPLRFR
jgi:subtilisin family serine protease